MFSPEALPDMATAVPRSSALTVSHRQIVAITSDPQGRNVVLALDRWDHIAARHPELAISQRDVVLTIRTPDAQRAVSTDESWFYKAAGPSAWIKVVVVYSGRKGRIITAFPRRAMP
jgi:hypothetical protein